MDNLTGKYKGPTTNLYPYTSGPNAIKPSLKKFDEEGEKNIIVMSFEVVRTRKRSGQLQQVATYYTLLEAARLWKILNEQWEKVDGRARLEREIVYRVRRSQTTVDDEENFQEIQENIPGVIIRLSDPPNEINLEFVSEDVLMEVVK